MSREIEQKPLSYFKSMADERLVEYVIDKHNGKSIGKFYMEDQNAYKMTLERGLIDRLVDEGVLIRKGRGNSQNMTDMLEDMAGWYRR